MKQKIAACLAALVTDQDGTAPPLGTANATDAGSPQNDSIEPGMILNIPPGRAVTVVDPPTVSEHDPYTRSVLRAIARGLGVTYEDLTGDYSQVNFSSARMARLRYWGRQHTWRWNMLVPQLLDPVWAWAMQAAAIVGLEETPMAEWTAPPMPMIEPDREGLAYQRNIRSGLCTLSEAIRERGYDPDAMLQEMADDWRKVDALGLILDSDPRKTTQQGGPRETAKATSSPADEPAPATTTNGNGAHAPAGRP